MDRPLFVRGIVAGKIKLRKLVLEVRWVAVGIPRLRMSTRTEDILLGMLGCSLVIDSETQVCIAFCLCDAAAGPPERAAKKK